MKIRITDLFDHYYDDSVMLDEPQLHETPTDITPRNIPGKHLSMHKPLLIAASLLLALCGAFVLNLGFDRSGGTALAEGDTLPSLQESVAESVFPEESVPEQPTAEADTGPQTDPTAEDYDPYEVAEHQLLVAELMLPLPLDEEEGMLLNLTLDLTYGDYIWYTEIPELSQALYDLSPDGTLREGLYDEAFSQAHTAWANAFLEAYMENAVVNFSDGSTLQIGSGDVINFDNGIFSEASGFAALAVAGGIDLSSTVPVSVTINTETFQFAESSAMMTDPTPTLDLPTEPLPDTDIVTETDINTAPAETSVIYGDGTQYYPAAQDTDGDGVLTAALNLEYGYMDSPAYVSLFTLDLTSGEFTWYNDVDPLVVLMSELSGNPTSQDFSDAMGDPEFNQLFTDWSNYVLEMIKSQAYLVFTDGTKVCLGSGDIIGYADAYPMFYDTGNIAWLGMDYDIALCDLVPSHLEILGDIYHFES